MRIPIRLLGALVAVITVFGVGLQSAYADSGRITLKVYKAGWIIGGSGGSGTLTFQGRTYRLGVGGIDYGLVFGGSKTVLHGRVSHIRRASDVEGVYGAAGAGLAVGRGVARYRSHQPEGRGSGALGAANRIDSERRPERVGDHDKIAGTRRQRRSSGFRSSGWRAAAGRTTGFRGRPRHG